MRSVILAAALVAVAGCGSSDDGSLGVGEYAVLGDELVCGAGGQLQGYTQPAGIATCTWDCVPQRTAEPVSITLEFLWTAGTWDLLREVTGPGHCSP